MDHRIERMINISHTIIPKKQVSKESLVEKIKVKNRSNKLTNDPKNLFEVKSCFIALTKELFEVLNLNLPIIKDFSRNELIVSNKLISENPEEFIKIIRTVSDFFKEISFGRTTLVDPYLPFFESLLNSGLLDTNQCLEVIEKVPSAEKRNVILWNFFVKNMQTCSQEQLIKMVMIYCKETKNPIETIQTVCKFLMNKNLLEKTVVISQMLPVEKKLTILCEIFTLLFKKSDYKESKKCTQNILTIIKELIQEFEKNPKNSLTANALSESYLSLINFGIKQINSKDWLSAENAKKLINEALSLAEKMLQPENRLELLKNKKLSELLENYLNNKSN